MAVRKPNDEHQDGGYLRLHKEVVRVRGRAAGYACIDCGGTAREWSQIHGTDGESVDDYEPRCNHCHGVYDGRFSTESQRKSAPPGRELTPQHRANIAESWNANPDRRTLSAEQIAATRKARWGR